MPGNVIAAVPVGVLPYSLTVGFAEELRQEALVNAYPDGQSERKALAVNARRYFRLQVPLRGTLWTTMYDFFNAHRGVPFYFYNLRETSPAWTYDATGTSTFGRYVVVFDGGWSETTGLPRSSAGFALREVA